MAAQVANGTHHPLGLSSNRVLKVGESAYIIHRHIIHQALFVIDTVGNPQSYRARIVVNRKRICSGRSPEFLPSSGGFDLDRSSSPTGLFCFLEQTAFLTHFYFEFLDASSLPHLDFCVKGVLSFPDFVQCSSVIIDRHPDRFSIRPPHIP